MRIIDEKGRLFGKINVIDFLVILFLISLTPMFYYGYKIFNAPPPPPPPPPPLQDYQTNIQAYILFKNFPPDIAKKIEIGDKELDGSGRVVAEITSIEKLEPNVILLGGGTTQIIDDTKKQILVKMLIGVNVTTDNRLLYKGENISYNSMVEFKTDKYSAKGIFLPSLSENLIITRVKFIGLIPELAAKIKKGDYEGILAKVRDNPIIEPYRPSYSHELPSNKKDVILSLEILCTKKDDGLLYYKNNPVKVGASFSFQTKEYDINGTIIGVEK